MSSGFHHWNVGINARLPNAVFVDLAEQAGVVGKEAFDASFAFAVINNE